MSSCADAITEKLVTVSPGDTVESALKVMQKAKTDTVPVIEEDGKLAGVFSLQILMKNLLPVSVAMGGGFQMDVKIPAAPGIAKRLGKMHSLTINDVMERKVFSAAPETPLWEGINLLIQHGSPLIIAEQGTGKVIGVVTNQSALDELTRLKDEP